MADTQPDAVVDGDACMLSPGELEVRVQEWRDLAENALTRTAEPGRVVSTYPASDAIRRRLRTLIEAEARCCSFLEFDIRDGAEAIEVELRYPDGFESVLALVMPGPARTDLSPRPA